MPHSPNAHRIVAAAVLVGGAVGLLAGPGTASAVVPGSNGLIAMSKCEDGPTSCNVAHIWTVDPSSGAEHEVTSGAAYDDDPAFSPDGSRIAFQHCPPNAHCRISIVDAAGGAVTDLTPGTYNWEDYPAFSPDGTKIVFARSDQGQHLVVMDATGGNEHPLTSGTSTDRAPSWSPDGSTVIFDDQDLAGEFRIYKVAAAGGSPLPLTSGPADHAPSFSPDGAHITFSGSDLIQIMDANGGNRHPLTAPAAGSGDGEPVFSPDGTQIVFGRWTTLTKASPLMVMNLDGSNAHAITGLSEKLFRPDWQPLPAAESQAGSGAQAAPAADTTAPTVTLRAPKRESVRKGRLYVLATSNEAGAGTASGKAAIRHHHKRYRLGSSTRGVAAGALTKVWVKIPHKPLRAIRAALVHHERATATIAVTVRDGAGNATHKAIRIRLDK